MTKFILIILVAMAFSAQVQAQQLPKTLKEEKWVQIMANDSAANYFEAEAAFQKFYTTWQAKEKAEKAREANDPAEEEQRKGPEEYCITAYVKWSGMIKPFVLPDGRIMPMSQRLAIIQEARKKQKGQ
jgi:hypothetical protein